MSKKTIVLADNSYTIRRIVELSFSEEEDIELVSFENSANLREKLLELKPAIVLVDIKLPEFNGYEVCRFINNTEGLKQTQVFLLKGGFEPVDENLLKGLTFVDIITKPFDSNALVSTIKNLLQEMESGTLPSAAEAVPPSIPEDMPEIGVLHEAGEEISFSDVKDEIDTEPIVSERPSQGPSMYPEDEVLPSEEITQAHGAQGDKEDILAPPIESPEDLENPFKDEMPAVQEEGVGSITEEELNIKRNIEEQERELEIGSLTQEELDIKQQIGEREQELVPPPTVDEFKLGEEDTSELMETKPSTLDVEAPESVSPVEDMFPFDKPQAAAEEAPPAPPEPPEPEVSEIPDLKAAEVEEEMGLGPDLVESPVTQKMEMPSPPPPPPPPADTEPKVEEESEPPISEYQPPSPFEEEKAEEPEPPAVDMGFEEPAVPAEPAEPAEPAVEIPSIDELKVETVPEPETEPPAMEYEAPAVETVEPATVREEPMEPEEPEEFEAIIPDIDALRVEIAPEGEAETPVMEYEVPAPPPPPPPPAPPAPEAEAEILPAAEIEEEKAEPAIPVEEVQPTVEEMPAVQDEQLLGRVEDKLTTAVKEMLWEIVPPLAERIIKEEIEKIKSEVSKSFK